MPPTLGGGCAPRRSSQASTCSATIDAAALARAMSQGSVLGPRSDQLGGQGRPHRVAVAAQQLDAA